VIPFDKHDPAIGSITVPKSFVSFFSCA
jgi:hypothetical protein